MKNWLIKILGGYTKQEYQGAFKYGGLGVATSLQLFAEKLFGVSSEEWCDRMYRQIIETKNEHSKF